jgi:hypothetical protein
MAAFAHFLAFLIGIGGGALFLYVGFQGGLASDIQIGFGGLMLVAGLMALGFGVEAADRARKDASGEAQG